MDYKKLSDDELIRYIGGGAQVGSQAFEGCQAELNRRMSDKSVKVSEKALFISAISALSAICAVIVSIVQLFDK